MVIPMLALALTLLSTPTYAAVEVGVAPSSLEEEYKPNLPDVIVVVDEIYEAELKRQEEWVSLGKFRTTGYCNCRKCCGKWAGGPTKSGAYPQEGVTIAVDKRVIPLGTEVMINGHVYIAQDTGSGIYGNRIDVYYENHSVAYSHGVQYAEVFVRK